MGGFNILVGQGRNAGRDKRLPAACYSRLLPTSCLAFHLHRFPSCCCCGGGFGAGPFVFETAVCACMPPYGAVKHLHICVAFLHFAVRARQRQWLCMPFVGGRQIPFSVLHELCLVTCSFACVAWLDGTYCVYNHHFV